MKPTPAMIVVASMAMLAVACRPSAPPLSVEEALDSLSLDTFLGHMTALSSDAMQGRRPGTAGYDSAAAYVVREARAVGLEPGGVDGTFQQPITFRRARVDTSAASFSVDGRALTHGVPSSSHDSTSSRGSATRSSPARPRRAHVTRSGSTGDVRPACEVSVRTLP